METNQKVGLGERILTIIWRAIVALFFTACVVLTSWFIFVREPRDRIALLETNKATWTKYYKEKELSSTPKSVVQALIDQVTVNKQLTGSDEWTLTNQSDYNYKYYGPKFLGWKINSSYFNISCEYPSTKNLPGPVKISLMQGLNTIDEITFSNWKVAASKSKYVGEMNLGPVALYFEASAEYGDCDWTMRTVKAKLVPFESKEDLYKRFLQSTDYVIPHDVYAGLEIAAAVEGRVTIPAFDQGNQQMVHNIGSSTRNLGWQLGAISENPQVWCGKRNPTVWIYLWNDKIPAQPITISEWNVSGPSKNGIFEFSHPVFLENSVLETRFYVSRTCDMFQLDVTVVPY